MHFSTRLSCDADGPRWGLSLEPTRADAAYRRPWSHKWPGSDFQAVAIHPDAKITGWLLLPMEMAVCGIRALGGEQKFVARRKQFRPEVLLEHPNRPDALASGFSVAVKLRPGWNHFKLQYKDGSGQWNTFTHCRIRLPFLWKLLQKFPRQVTNNYYESWCYKCGDASEWELEAMRSFLPRFKSHPLISVLMPVYNPPARWLARAIESVRQQIYPNWELVIADDCSDDPAVREVLLRSAAEDARIRVCFRQSRGHISKASNTALTMCRGSFTALLDHDDEIPKHALYHLAWEISEHPETNIIFSDEDKIDCNGVRSGPYFKPGWNFELLLQQNCVSHFGCFRTALMREVGGFRTGYEGSQDWDLTLRAVAHAGSGNVRHIPRMLYHWRMLESSTASGMQCKPYAHQAGRAAVEDYLAVKHPGAELGNVTPRGWQVSWPAPARRPLVSLIILGGEGAGDLQALAASIYEHTSYEAFEVLVVDDVGTDSAAVWELRGSSLRESFPRAQINGDCGVSRAVNAGAGVASGEVLVLLQGLNAVGGPGWLDELVRQACRADVGAVGAVIVDENNVIQDAGRVLNMKGPAGRVFRNFPVNAPSIAGHPGLVREVTAVSACCLAVRKQNFDRAEGFDETQFPDRLADVDFCLRLRSLALRNIVTPFSRVVTGQLPAQQVSHDIPEAPGVPDVRLQTRWHDVMRTGDLFFNANLSLRCEIPVPSAPQTAWPWMELCADPRRSSDSPPSPSPTPPPSREEPAALSVTQL